jgi:acetylglutamate kinase
MIVIKLGGAALKATLAEPRLFQALASCREPLVIVHGGGPRINAIAESLHIKSDFVGGQRVTSPEMMDVVEMVLSGGINPALVRGLLKAGRKAFGLSGVQGGIFHCSVENPALGLVGKVDRVDTAPILSLLQQGYLPVISPVGLLPGFEPCNVNADLATARVAMDLKATRVLFLTDKDGILDAEGSTLRILTRPHLESLMASEVVSGGMKVKARAILEVLAANPEALVSVMNGLEPEVLSAALQGADPGTRIS